jgi:radical SAM superfamily enzyme YgiQ (UPF0313 family)
MPKLILINPVGKKSGYLMSSISRFAPLGLAYIAAATPDSWDIEIIDENHTDFLYKPADLVGITAFTSNINRAYDIAQVYRRNGTKVIIGGIHASMTPDETSHYADAVVIGEAEEIWPQVIRDFEQDNLSRRYEGPHINLSRGNIRPRRDLLNPNYFWQSVQTSRGCPFDCYFCSVSRYLGRRYRQRQVEDVLDEIASIESPHIAFVDDNLIGYGPKSQERAKALFRGMIKHNLNKKWWMQTSINAAEDEEVIRLAARAGCLFVFIGFETIDQGTLEKMDKGINLKSGVDSYKNTANAFHRHGIGVLGAFILGNDHELPPYYQRLARFLLRSGIDAFQISILTPLPGTRLMDDKLASDELIYDDFPGDWEKYRFSYMVHKTRGVKPEDVYIGDNYIKSRLYSFPFFHYRMLRSFLLLKNPTNFMVTLKLNQALKRSWQNAHYYHKYPHRFDSRK